MSSLPEAPRHRPVGIERCQFGRRDEPHARLGLDEPDVLLEIAEGLFGLGGRPRPGQLPLAAGGLAPRLKFTPSQNSVWTHSLGW